jgi:hypothetical protein
MAKVAEHLPSKLKALSSNPLLPEKKKKERERERQEARVVMKRGNPCSTEVEEED